jgi:predicted patatin/cPLA2 family phospholipase
MKRLDAVPEHLLSQVQIPGLKDVRYRVGIDTDAMFQECAASFHRELADLENSGYTGGPLPPAVYLSISGGGDNGAFAAGLLNGWTQSGSRPEFKLVTGISTGGLIAPFAFLGPAYDAKLKELYTNVSQEDILIKRSFLATVMSDAMMDNKPLWQRLEKEITREFLDKIAFEYEKGRLLMIGTTDLDAGLSVIWNMGRLSTYQDPRALELFRAVMIASSSIPGAFPPVMIDVDVNGKSYQEMHVDGGAMAQVFLYPPSLHLNVLSREHKAERQRTLYIIRNSRLDPQWANTERRVMSIAKRAISSLIHTQGLGNLYQIYLTTQRDSIDYNLAFIPSTFDAIHREDFDTQYMCALYDTGYQLAEKGYSWHKHPPGHGNK